MYMGMVEAFREKEEIYEKEVVEEKEIFVFSFTVSTGDAHLDHDEISIPISWR